MRVGYVLKRYPRYSETFIVTEILAHEAAGLEIEIFSLRPPEDSHFQDAIARVRAPVHYLSAHGLKILDFWTALEQASQVMPGLWAALENAQGHNVREIYQAVLLAHQVYLKDLQLLHAHFATSATSVARLAGLFAGVPYTFTAHAKDIFHQGVQPDELRRKLSDAAAVITISGFNATYLRQTYDLAAGCVRHIYNGLEIERFPFAVPHDRPPLVVGVGRLVEKKGFADLIEACGLLSRRGCNFTCQIIGTGELEADLRAQIAHLGIQDRVALQGPLPQNDVRHRIRSAAVLAAPCLIGADGNRDGLPTVLLEAMALGTPCVSTDVTGIPEVLRDGETGLSVPQHDPAALATAIERLLGDPALRVQVAQRARSLVEERFDSRRNATALRGVFHSVARTGAPVAQGV
ncbi:MAG TPA: glycosyltransferase family 4 protein [Candidatus Binatia bacterium]|jgi:glycosyltransferase involved in cell wall biosynthesis|nr:glycosyltransferase family 4 protein [Candidatus Binatia bacterium]